MAQNDDDDQNKESTDATATSYIVSNDKKKRKLFVEATTKATTIITHKHSDNDSTGSYDNNNDHNSKSRNTQGQGQLQLQLQREGNNGNNTKGSSKRKRMICDRCHRPKPQTCICSSLPTNLIQLQKVEIIILQHPLELKNHKSTANRSVPLLELCLDSKSLHLVQGRRFGMESLGTELYKKLHNSNGNDHTITEKFSYIPVLVFPKLKKETTNQIQIATTSTIPTTKTNIEQSTSREEEQKKKQFYREEDVDVLSLSGLLRKMKEDDDEGKGEGADCLHDVTSTDDNTNDQSEKQKEKKRKKKILLLILDATWNHAREMHMANIRLHQYPMNMLRVALEKEDLADHKHVPGRFQVRGKASTKGYQKRKSSSNSKKKNSNEESEPLDGTWMSTAECIAWIVSKLEEEEQEQPQDYDYDEPQQQQTINIENATTNDGSTASSITTTTPTTTPNKSTTTMISPSTLSLYEILMKPLDAMVLKWKSFVEQNKSN